MESTHIDATWFQIRGQSNSKLLIGVLYRSGSPTLAIPRNETLHTTLNWAATSNNTHKLIVGDFNHPEITWTPAPKFREGQTPTRDDLIITDEQEMVEQLRLLDPLGASDHIVIDFTMMFSAHTPTNDWTIPNYNKVDYDAIRSMLDIKWEEMLDGLNVQRKTNTIESAIQEAMDKCIPKKTKGNNRKKKPLWMDSAALRKVKKKYHAWIRYLNTKDGRAYQEYTKDGRAYQEYTKDGRAYQEYTKDGRAYQEYTKDGRAYQEYTKDGRAYHEYITARNEAAHATRKARRDFEAKLATEVKWNNKRFWSYVNSQRKTKTGVADLEDQSLIPNTEKKHIEHSLHININQDCVKKKLKLLKTEISPGPDQICPRVLQEIAGIITLPFTLLYIRSLETREVPQQWKIATVIPIFKKGNKSLPANYRPVLLTFIICKVMERIISEDILEHLRSTYLLCDQQHEFIGWKLTVTNLLEALDIWTEALSHNLPVDVLFLDYAKAFDTVPHE
ncbi:uncharacterized protein LOC143023364 [Oratosquilla oratoria]|uniref:uncharacterized protein LOC143023364 n=1 Tax=Oratosquilla oratoria TaxID=337810 RepID=UPI003F75856E